MLLAGCGGTDSKRDASYLPLPVGHGPGYRPPALSPAVREARPLPGLACRAGPGPRNLAHIELFAARRVVVVPAGVGVSPPQRREGARILAGRCYYPVATFEPTGVVAVARGARTTIGQLFAIWGQPLSRWRLAGFGGATIAAFVDGRRVFGDPGSIPLTAGSEIVLEINGQVPPHASYRFG